MTALTLFMALSAIVAALNPCTLAVVVMSVSSILGKGKHPRHAGLHTLMFALGTFLAYASLALVWRLILLALPTGVVGYIGIVLAVIIVLFGLFEIKDYFWYGKGLSFKLSAPTEKKIHTWTKTHHSHFRGFLLGIYTALRLSHYTLVLALSSVLLLSLLTPSDPFAGMLWSLWYIAPLAVIAILLVFGVDAHSLTTWKEQTKHNMRLSIGVIYILIGWVILTVLAGGLKLV